MLPRRFFTYDFLGFLGTRQGICGQVLPPPSLGFPRAGFGFWLGPGSSLGMLATAGKMAPATVTLIETLMIVGAMM